MPTSAVAFGLIPVRVIIIIINSTADTANEFQNLSKLVLF